MGKTDPRRALFWATVSAFGLASSATGAERTTQLGVSALVVNVCEVESRGAEARVTCDMAEEATLSVTGGNSQRLRLRGDRPARIILPAAGAEPVLVIAY